MVLLALFPRTENFDITTPRLKILNIYFLVLPVDDKATSTTANCEARCRLVKMVGVVDDGEDALVKLFGTCAFQLHSSREMRRSSVSERTWENIFEKLLWRKLANMRKMLNETLHHFVPKWFYNRVILVAVPYFFVYLFDVNFNTLIVEKF
ncbi:hypothetical protein P4S73_06945 [Paraglaciecola sp. Hal342]